MKAAVQGVRGAVPALPQARPAHVPQQHSSGWCRRKHVVRGLQVPNEPGYDDLKLDDAFYKELGIDEEEREAQKTYEPDDIDPMGVYADDLESMAALNPDASPDLLAAVDNATDIWGPKALLLAGLRLEEVAVTREIMDALGAAEVKVVPTTAAMLHMPLHMALAAPEPDWEKPRVPDAAQGGGWGSQRVALFSGLSVKAVATAVEVLEESGLPPLCVAMADEEDAQQQLGRVLAETVRDHHGRKNPSKQLWEESPRVSDALPDLDTLIKEATSDRLKQFETAAKEGRLEEVLAESAIEMTPEEVQQLKAREAADGAAAGVADVKLEPQEPNAGISIPQQHPPSSSETAAAGTAQAQQPAQGAAVADPSQAQPVHRRTSAAPDGSIGSTVDSLSPMTAKVHSTTGSLQPSQQMHAQPAGVSSGLGAQEAQTTNSSAAAPSQSHPASRHSMYQRPAGPQPPPGLLEREQFLADLRQRQQQEQQEADAEAEQQQQPAPDAAAAAAAAARQPNSDAQENFLAKYTFETLAMQREAAEAANVPVGPLGWQAELASVQSEGITRTDVLQGREPQQRRRFRGSTGDFDTIDRIVEQPELPKTQTAEYTATSSVPLDRNAIEAALRSGMDPAELKRLIDEAAAAFQPSANGQGETQPPRNAAPPTATPWQQANGARRRGRPALSRKSPFEGAAPRPRRQVEDVTPAVEPMTGAEIEAAARKLGERPKAWLQDARERGILATPDRP